MHSSNETSPGGKFVGADRASRELRHLSRAVEIRIAATNYVTERLFEVAEKIPWGVGAFTALLCYVEAHYRCWSKKEEEDGLDPVRRKHPHSFGVPIPTRRPSWWQGVYLAARRFRKSGDAWTSSAREAAELAYAELRGRVESWPRAVEQLYVSLLTVDPELAGEMARGFWHALFDHLNPVESRRIELDEMGYAFFGSRDDSVLAHALALWGERVETATSLHAGTVTAHAAASGEVTESPGELAATGISPYVPSSSWDG